MDVVMSGSADATPNSQPSTVQSTTSEKGHQLTIASPGKKHNLTLDLNASSTKNISLTVPTSTAVDFRTSPGFVLTSPDVQMLQLASPELEKFIIQGLMGQNTPTPTQLVFPKNVTEEQGA
jgi:Jun-like transcription factor